MRLSAPLLAAFFACGSAAPVGAQTTPIKPGYWESHNRMGIGPFSLARSVERKCLTPKDMDKFMDGPSNGLYACTYPERNFKDGQISMSGLCIDRKRGTRISVRLNGSYSPTAFNMRARLQWGLLVASGSMSAERIGDVCPPGTEIKHDRAVAE